MPSSTLTHPTHPSPRSLPPKPRPPKLLSHVPPELEDELFNFFFDASHSIPEIAVAIGCSIRAIARWHERPDVQAELASIARLKSSRAISILDDKLERVIDAVDVVIHMIGSDKFHYATPSAQANMMETVRKSAKDLGELRKTLALPDKPAKTDEPKELASTSAPIHPSAELPAPAPAKAEPANVDTTTTTETSDHTPSTDDPTSELNPPPDTQKDKSRSRTAAASAPDGEHTIDQSALSPKAPDISRHRGYGPAD